MFFRRDTAPEPDNSNPGDRRADFGPRLRTFGCCCRLKSALRLCIELLTFLVVVVACMGCRTAPHQHVPDAVDHANSVTNTASPRVGWHTIIHRPDPDKPPIRTIDKFNPVWWFANRDQPNPPEDYHPGDKSRLLKWRMRNPFHNFSYYVIGIADKKFKRSGCHPEQTFLRDGGWNFAVSRYKVCPRPFLSWCHGTNGFHFYCGWRTAGNFGLKLNVE